MTVAATGLEGWLGDHLGLDVRAVSPLQCTVASVLWDVRVGRGAVGAHYVARQILDPAWLLREGDLATREAGALAVLGELGLPTPRLVALDPDGAETGAPTVLMTWLDGSPVPTPADHPRVVPEAARALASLHRSTGSVALPAELPAYAPHYRTTTPAVTVEAPARTGDRGAWREALEVYRTASWSPPDGAVLLHRDFHLGNLLWSGPEVTGIVDWVTASIGDPHADVGHVRWNLAIEAGSARADAFLATYQEAAEGPRPRPYSGKWDLFAAVGGLPDLRPLDTGSQARLDAFVRRALDRIDP